MRGKLVWVQFLYRYKLERRYMQEVPNVRKSGRPQYEQSSMTSICENIVMEAVVSYSLITLSNIDGSRIKCM